MTYTSKPCHKNVRLLDTLNMIPVFLLSKLSMAFQIWVDLPPTTNTWARGRGWTTKPTKPREIARYARADFDRVSKFVNALDFIEGFVNSH